MQLPEIAGKPIQIAIISILEFDLFLAQALDMRIELLLRDFGIGKEDIVEGDDCPFPVSSLLDHIARANQIDAGHRPTTD